MLRSILNYFRAFFYYITGRVDDARRALSSNPYVIEATYDKIVEEKRNNLDRYRTAIAKLISQEEKKRQTATKLSDEIQYHEKLIAGAAAKGKDLLPNLTRKYNGDTEQVKRDPEYIKCQTAFRDFSSTIMEKKKYAKEVEDDLGELSTKIGEHKANIQSLLRDLQKIQEEKHSTVAEVISAKEEKEIGDLLSGVSIERSSKELAELRDIRSQARATARISREMAGLTNKSTESDFLSYAEGGGHDTEFEKLVGFSQPKLITNEKVENS
jgi:hypothetical protein